MEIERINENTLKFYISYQDIEERGFTREDIWYNREKGEELFWDMMDEVNDHEDFSVDGPLWIQVQAMDKGLEIVVTKAQISKDGNKLELPDADDPNGQGVTHELENFMDQSFSKDSKASNENKGQKKKKKKHLDDDLTLMVTFNDIEDAISLSQSVQDTRFVTDRLFAFDDQYFIHVGFPNGFLSEDEQEDYISRLLEFGEESAMTKHYLTEYGVEIFEDDAMKQLRTHF
ncbi:adaptor protein MecA [Alkalibacillus almallahensis]|uniref:adaptor protein MecA n=1 Tax=Alkalibacillus almallahensis TaxID=1379154 RepID=UPI001420764E|nr:adaptor protein MecA [Alkalibacillus almallahensis]NIK13211.1 adapter protein MecA 1/2 [Alkalibacillus almallahensis]